MQDAVVVKFVLICGVVVFWARAAPGNESFQASVKVGPFSASTTVTRPISLLRYLYTVIPTIIIYKSNLSLLMHLILDT